MTRLMLVEDDDNERYTLCRLLERAGHEVIAVRRAEDALDVFSSQPFDALITDVMMPGKDGLSLAHEVRRLRPDVPIVLVSAFHFARSQLERAELASLTFIDKPIDIDRLLTLLAAPPPAPPSDRPRV